MSVGRFVLGQDPRQRGGACRSVPPGRVCWLFPGAACGNRAPRRDVRRPPGASLAVRTALRARTSSSTSVKPPGAPWCSSTRAATSRSERGMTGRWRRRCVQPGSNPRNDSALAFPHGIAGCPRSRTDHGPPDQRRQGQGYGCGLGPPVGELGRRAGDDHHGAALRHGRTVNGVSGGRSPAPVRCSASGATSRGSKGGAASPCQAAVFNTA